MNNARHPTLRRYVVPGLARTSSLAVLGVLASWRLATGQGGAGWLATPDRPTVGDTVWLERTVPAPAGWRVRPGRLEPAERLEPLAAPAVLRAPDGWVVRYPVVAWVPGARSVSFPPIWRLGPDGRADSLPGGVAAFEVRSVIPDSIRQPAPKGGLAPVRSERQRPLPAAIAAVLAAGLLAAGLWWRRRPPRPPPPSLHVPLEPDVPDARWLAAGEPKAVAARTAARVRAAIAREIPGASPAQSTAECLAAIERARPNAPLRELRAVLEQLDRVAFASAHGTDVAALAERVRALTRQLTS
jgi:hypothetical protein